MKFSTRKICNLPKCIWTKPNKTVARKDPKKHQPQNRNTEDKVQSLNLLQVKQDQIYKLYIIDGTLRI